MTSPQRQPKTDSERDPGKGRDVQNEHYLIRAHRAAHETGKRNYFVPKLPYHLGSGSRTHSVWKSMLARVDGKQNRECYFDRGINMDPRWRDYRVFLDDMGICPPGLSIDRKDNDKGYWPWNCRWATVEQQLANKRMHGKKGKKTGNLASRYGFATEHVEELLRTGIVDKSQSSDKGVRICEATKEVAIVSTSLCLTCFREFDFTPNPSKKRGAGQFCSAVCRTDHRPLTQVAIETAIRMRSEGRTLAEISDILGGTSLSAISVTLSRHNRAFFSEALDVAA